MKVLVCAASKYGATSQASKARDHRIFAGKLARKQLRFPERAMASAIRAPDGDFRNWAEIREWAASIADALLA